MTNAQSRPARHPAALLMQIRAIHTYVGMLIAPTVLFFACTGILQIYSLHEAHGGYTPPPGGEEHHAKPATTLLKAVFAAVALGLIGSTCAGLWMALRQLQLSASHCVVPAMVRVVLAGHVSVRRIQRPVRRRQVLPIKVEPGHGNLILRQKSLNRLSTAIGRQLALRHPHLLLRFRNRPGANRCSRQVKPLGRNQLLALREFKHAQNLSLQKKSGSHARGALLHLLQSCQSRVEPHRGIVARIEPAHGGQANTPCGLVIPRVHGRPAKQVSGPQFKQGVVALMSLVHRAQE